MRRAGAGTGYALTPRMLVLAIGSLLLIQGASAADQDTGKPYLSFVINPKSSSYD